MAFLAGEYVASGHAVHAIVSSYSEPSQLPWRISPASHELVQLAHFLVSVLVEPPQSEEMYCPLGHAWHAVQPVSKNAVPLHVDVM